MKKIGIIGGGAAGYFCAANIKNKDFQTLIFEQGGRVLKKVKISGGGRCNVTHNIFENKQFCENYPRGQKELLAPSHQFQALNTLKWFADKNIKIVAESDGRMFPTSNDSQTIIDCLKSEANKNKAELLVTHKVNRVKYNGDKFTLSFNNQEDISVDKLLICTGSSEGGYELAKSLGHTITERAPSLFSFKVKHPVLKDLSGLSFKDCEIKLNFPNIKKKFTSSGPLLITHWGFSGPAILKLSAWTAREMKKENYKAKLTIRFTNEDLNQLFSDKKSNNPKSKIINAYPHFIQRRFWENLVSYLRIDPNKVWSEVSKKELNSISQALTQLEFNVNGQNRYKDEFVECGGVNLKEINFKTMESKIVPNLYFAGEILDIDGVTGGFNFQNAWTTAWITAQNITNTNSTK